jgi:phosphatidylglycerophosphate synthase
MACLLAQQVLVIVPVLRSRHALSLVDGMTLTRGGAAAILLGSRAAGSDDRQGPAGWMAWFTLLYGAILCDWLDGPIARHRGTSRVGVIFDLEADSWLTLASALCAVGMGGLSRYVLVGPVGRYVMLGALVRTVPYGRFGTDQPAYVRRTGIAQMLLFIAALAPFGGRATRAVVRVASPVVALVQAGSLVQQYRYLRRSDGA